MVYICYYTHAAIINKRNATYRRNEVIVYNEQLLKTLLQSERYLESFRLRLRKTRHTLVKDPDKEISCYEFLIELSNFLPAKKTIDTTTTVTQSAPREMRNLLWRSIVGAVDLRVREKLFHNR